MNLPFLKNVKLSKRDKKIIWLGSAAGVVILLVSFVIMPFRDNKKNVREELKQKKLDMQRNLQILEEKDDYKKTIEDLNKRLEQYNARLLPESTPAQAKVKLEEALIDMATKAGVDPSNRRPEREEKLSDEYQKISIRVDQILCMPDQAMTFLYHIRTFDKYFLTIDQLDIQPSSYTPVRGTGTRDNKIRLGATISAVIRVTPEKKEEAPRSKPAATSKPGLQSSELYRISVTCTPAVCT
jgi:hypothetical protein